MNGQQAFVPISNYTPLPASSVSGTAYNLLLDINGSSAATLLQSLLNGCQITTLGNVENLPVVSSSDISTVDQARVYITFDQLQAAVASLGLSLTSTQLTDLISHLTNYNNPHKVDAAQVGLGSVADYPPISSTDITNKTFGKEYVTYDLLKSATDSLSLMRYMPTFNALTAFYNITTNTVTLGISIESSNGYDLTNTQITFQYRDNNAAVPVWTTISTTNYSSSTIDYYASISGLSLGNDYTFQAVLTDTTNPSTDVTSSPFNMTLVS